MKSLLRVRVVVNFVSFVLAWVLTASSSYTQCPMFAPKVDYTVGLRTYGLVSADFDGDGDFDLAASAIRLFTSDGIDTVHVLMNDGNGVFATTAKYSVGDAPFLSSADFDGDSDIDLAAGDAYTNRVYILLNDGLGTFVVSDSISSEGVRPFEHCNSDLDNDGYPDLVVPNFLSAFTSILKNNGDGTFVFGGDLTSGSFPLSPVTGDLDHDGDSDVVVTNGNLIGTVSVFINNGSLSFSSAVTYAVGLHAYGLSLADFDMDGHLDLVVGNANPSTPFVSVLLGKGDGTFDPMIPYTGCRPHIPACADYDLDGDIDMAVTNNECNSISIFLNNGGGTGTFAPHFTLGTGVGPQNVLARDFDGDGDIDLAANNFENDGAPGNSISVFMNWTNDIADADDDGTPDVCDNCTDTDGDGFGNPGFAANTCAVDNCPDIPNPLQENTDGTGPGDSCCCVGIRGDANGDGGVQPNILDLTYLVDRIFRGGPPVGCPKEGNANSDGASAPNILDLTFLVDRIFRGGPPPGAC